MMNMRPLSLLCVVRLTVFMDLILLTLLLLRKVYMCRREALPTLWRRKHPPKWVRQTVPSGLRFTEMAGNR